MDAVIKAGLTLEQSKLKQENMNSGKNLEEEVLFKITEGRNWRTQTVTQVCSQRILMVNVLLRTKIILIVERLVTSVGAGCTENTLFLFSALPSLPNDILGHTSNHKKN